MYMPPPLLLRARELEIIIFLVSLVALAASPGPA